MKEHFNLPTGKESIKHGFRSRMAKQLMAAEYYFLVVLGRRAN